jgi:hypothetical protein
MANCLYNIDEIRFDVRDPEWTNVYVYLETNGSDCPFMVQGWHHKAYPHTMTTDAIHAKLRSTEEDDPVLWPRRAPPEVFKTQAGELARAILTWPMGMDPAHANWAHWEGLRMMAESVIGERNEAELRRVAADIRREFGFD